ncbi:helix-turn-helix transcriptional regulator [Sphingomonas sp. ASV193]|uniref:helix-turn-helix domain-containing protein n=1 Tax=Sphingomonas sp. ASV193 TaxID=3144405 RepID=UPI0032E8E6EC
MTSPKVRPVLSRLGNDIRSARLRRRLAVADLAVRAGTSPSSIARLEKGDQGVAIGTLADVLVVLGLAERLGDLVDVRKDDLGLALASEQLPQRGRSTAARRRTRTSTSAEGGSRDDGGSDGIAF